MLITGQIGFIMNETSTETSMEEIQIKKVPVTIETEGKTDRNL
jgi:hypothetical protein